MQKFSWFRMGLANTGLTETFGPLVTEGGLFKIHTLDMYLTNSQNAPGGAGATTVDLRESDPLNNWVAGTVWLQRWYTYAAVTPGIDNVLSWNFGDDGWLVPRHTPFNEFRRFGYSGGIAAGFLTVPPIFEMTFSFDFAYEESYIVNYLS